MRSIFCSLLSLATIATSLAIEPRTAAQTDAAAGDDWDAEEVVPDTIFNGQTVPPMQELGTDVDKQMPAIIAVKNRYVKAPFPTWTAVQVSRLIPPDGITEIKLIAKQPK